MSMLEEPATNMVATIAEEHGLRCVLNGLGNHYSDDEIIDAIKSVQAKQQTKFGNLWWTADDVLGLEFGDDNLPLSKHGLTEEDAEEILSSCEKYLKDRAIEQGWDTLVDQIHEYLTINKPELYAKLFPEK